MLHKVLNLRVTPAKSNRAKSTHQKLKNLYSVKDGVKRPFIAFPICCMKMLPFAHGEFKTKYGLNVDFLTYNACVQAVKKYIKSL